MSEKSKVFVIMPFNDDFLALYEELKTVFADNFIFTNAGDLDNQQNILQDIVQGIYYADVVIADLTGMNANVFYELGLAHAMNKKVIIITQDIGELPFDIKSYRANEYSLQFNKLPKLIEELKKLLMGAIDHSVKYGNPVSDYIPDFFKHTSNALPGSNLSTAVEAKNVESDETAEEEGEEGFLDYVTNITENSAKMTDEITAMGEEMNEMNVSINGAANEINRTKAKNGNVDASFARNICRKLSEPINVFAGKLKGHVNNVSGYWGIVENSYLSLLDNQYAQNVNNTEEIRDSMAALKRMQSSIHGADEKIESFVSVLQGCMGMERRFNKAVSSLIAEFDEYLQMTGTMYSSIDRILRKGDIILEALEKE